MSVISVARTPERGMPIPESSRHEFLENDPEFVVTRERIKKERVRGFAEAIRRAPTLYDACTLAPGTRYACSSLAQDLRHEAAQISKSSRAWQPILKEMRDVEDVDSAVQILNQRGLSEVAAFGGGLWEVFSEMKEKNSKSE